MKVFVYSKKLFEGKIWEDIRFSRIERVGRYYGRFFKLPWFVLFIGKRIRGL